LEEILIRQYRAGDRDAVRKICCDTAFMGEPLERFFDDKETAADLLTSYYTDYEPESTFVAGSDGKVVGYLTGCKDTAGKEKVFSRKILPKAFLDFLKKGLIFRKRTAEFLLNSLLSGGSKQPKVSREYPAHLHINVDEGYRRRGVGAKLMNAFFEYLKKNKIKGVHLATFSEDGSSFFVKNGFTILWESATSRWRYIVNRDVKIYIFGKILD